MKKKFVHVIRHERKIIYINESLWKEEDIINEITIEITSYCPHNCSFCSSNASTEGDHLSLNQIKDFINTMHLDNNSRINISGGEPLSHPQFWDILQLCKKITRDVWVYTNAFENIRYNSAVIPEINCEANICLVPGTSVYIPSNADKIHLLQLVPQGRAKNLLPANIHVSTNITNKTACIGCDHILLQADGKIVKGPCKKSYD